jgi:hypothetical protein
MFSTEIIFGPQREFYCVNIYIDIIDVIDYHLYKKKKICTFSEHKNVFTEWNYMKYEINKIEISVLSFRKIVSKHNEDKKRTKKNENCKNKFSTMKI